MSFQFCRMNTFFGVDSPGQGHSKLTAIVLVRIVLTFVVIVALCRSWDALLTVAASKFVPITGHEHGRPILALLSWCGRGGYYCPDGGRCGRTCEINRSKTIVQNSKTIF